MEKYKATNNNLDYIPQDFEEDVENDFSDDMEDVEPEVANTAPSSVQNVANIAKNLAEKSLGKFSGGRNTELMNKAFNRKNSGVGNQNKSETETTSSNKDKFGSSNKNLLGLNQGNSLVNNLFNKNGKGLFSLSNSTKDGIGTGNFLKKIFNKMPPSLKIKIIIGCMVCILFLMMIYTVFAQDDITNLKLTNGSTMSSSLSSGAGDLASSLEEVATWYIENVATYSQSLYVESPFSTSKVRADCTGFAVAYMSYVAGVDIPDSYSGEMIYPDGNWAKTVEGYGWKAYTSDEIGTLQTGDVLISHVGYLYSTKGKHAEIYVDESHTFGWGSVKTAYPTSNTITTTNSGGHVHFMDSGHDYITIYRYEGELSSGTSSIGNSNLNVTKMYDTSFNHGTKSKSNQKYIMLHDTEMSQDAKTVVQSWKNSGNGIAAHFVVDRDGTVIQAVDLDTITHHAGWGGPGDYDTKFGVGNNDGKGNGDDLVGTSKSGYASYTSYGMNSYSIGIEMCHVNGEDYPEAQLEAVDKVIAYIDSYYGFKSTIIDHKEWRPSNSDTDSKFATYLNNYKTLRHH